ncbi:hypothetical protein GCM10020219_017780 [Nonomuraea dietziae]
MLHQRASDDPGPAGQAAATPEELRDHLESVIKKQRGLAAYRLATASTPTCGSTTTLGVHYIIALPGVTEGAGTAPRTG